MLRRIVLLSAVLLIHLAAQDQTDSHALMLQILQRLDTLERENHQLIEELHALKQQLNLPQRPAASPAQPSPEASPQSPKPSLDERVTVAERRIAEQAQTKVEASQKFPISLNGMLLFNAFLNSANVTLTPSTSNYGLLSGPSQSGATVRQSLLGLDFQGPSLPGSGRVNGSLMMDFWAGSSAPGVSWLRIRRAYLSLDWPNRSFTVGQDKPLISPYAPDSLAEVGIPPLAGAGNLWRWLPQARYEERLHLGEDAGLIGQIAVLQTADEFATVPQRYANSLAAARPALEGRFALWHKLGDDGRIEFAPGFHLSSTHVAGTSVGSQIASLDWLFAPNAKFQFTGTYFHGQNIAGLGSLGNGFAILPDGEVYAIRAQGGWSQFSTALTKRLTLNLFAGLEDDEPGKMLNYQIARNLTYASNLIYHLGPNVVIGLEGLQMRTRTPSGVREVSNHYDLAFGYLF
ncbi:MAG TPA: hypothetical protein VKX41_11995 [Alloacidobacterium sp.]|nr:hypothetical protein [Alloacidobacterium sp.]